MAVYDIGAAGLGPNAANVSFRSKNVLAADYRMQSIMNAKNWLPIPSIIVSAIVFAYVVDMLDWEDLVSNSKIASENNSGQTTAALPDRSATVSRKSISEGTAPGINLGPEHTSPEASIQNARPLEMTESGMPIGEGIHPDPEEVENRILGEQLAESLRNPAYLQYEGEEAPSDEDLAADTPSEEAAEAEMAEVSPDDGGGSEAEDESTLNAETSADASFASDESAKRPQMTEAGVLISEQEHPDPAELEDRLMAEQLTESQRNPAYLQTEQSEPPEEKGYLRNSQQ